MENNNVGEREVWGQGMGGIVRIDIEIKKRRLWIAVAYNLQG